MLDFSRAFVVKMETILTSRRDAADQGKPHKEARRPYIVSTGLPDISAFARSGWAFAATRLARVWIGIKSRLHQDQ